MKQYFIYLTTNLKNNKKYIGRHYGEINDSYLGSGTEIKQAIREEGRENFQRQILQICNTAEEMYKAEQFWIQQYNAVQDNNFYNRTSGGENDIRQWAQDHPEKAQQLFKENGQRLQTWMQEHPEKARQIYEERYQSLQKWVKEHPEEIKQLRKDNNKYLKQWRKDNPDKVLQHLADMREKLKIWNQEHPEEQKRNIQKMLDAATELKRHRIKCITTNEIFASINEAGRNYNVDPSSISKAVRHIAKSAGKHPITKEPLIWERISQEEYEAELNTNNFDVTINNL